MPEIRFEEFNGEWEENRLSDIVKLFGGNAFSSSDSRSFGIPWLKIANVGINGIDWSTSSYLPDEFWTCYKDYRLYKGDYVMALTRPILNHILKISIVDKKALLNQRVAKLIFATNAEYGYQLLQRRFVVDKIENELEGTDPPNLGSGNLKNIDISITLNKDEQSKIGNFFNRLDETISLHQQELTALKQTKQGFLQKMFPKQGKSVPRVRFPGFSGEWEELKADEIFHSVSDKNHSYLPVLSASQEKGMVYRDEIGIDIKYDEKSTNNYKRVLPGQFVIHLRSFQGGFAFSNIEGITSPAYTVLDFKNKEKHHSLFWKHVLASDTFIKRLETVTYGIRDGRSISYSDFSTLKFRVPSYNEQIKIGEFFKGLDRTIALHQQELDTLKETKQGFLQKMFV